MPLRRSVGKWWDWTRCNNGHSESRTLPLRQVLTGHEKGCKRSPFDADWVCFHTMPWQLKLITCSRTALQTKDSSFHTENHANAVFSSWLDSANHPKSHLDQAGRLSRAEFQASNQVTHIMSLDIALEPRPGSHPFLWHSTLITIVVSNRLHL